MSILDSYILKATLAGTFLVLLVLDGLSSFMLFVRQLDDIGTGRYELTTAINYVLLKLPQTTYELFPIAALLGGLLGLGQLAQRSEFVVMRTSGVSLLQLARSVAIAGLVLVAIAAAIGELLAPPAEQYAIRLKAMTLNERLSLTREGVWVRDGTLFVNVNQVGREDRLGEIFIYDFDDRGELEYVRRAQSARHDGQSWVLYDVTETRFLESGRTRTVAFEELPWSSRLSPELLSLFVTDESILSLKGLSDYIGYLEANGLDASRHRLTFWGRISSLVTVLLMAILALPFNFGNLRTAGAGQRVMVGVLVGVGFFIFDRTLANSGLVFGLHPVVVAWLPTAILAAVCAAALRRVY